MKRGMIFILLSILVLSLFLAKANINETNSSEKEIKLSISSDVLEKIEKQDVRVYIKLKSSIKRGKSITSREVKQEVSDILGKKIKHEFDDRFSALISEEELLELQNNSNIESIKLVGTRTISLQDSVPLINSSTELWSLQANGTNLTGEGETICIIDTGVAYNHSDLGGCYGNNSASSSCKVLGGWDYCADDTTCTSDDSDPMDSHWHGTHVSGIASADGGAKGVAPDTKLIVIKAANASGTFWDDDLEKAIDWCVNNASTFNISVISMSLGGGLYSSYCNDDPLNDSINTAVANNISVVVASGNDAKTSQIAGPACVQNATPVGGTDKSDAMYSDGNRNSLVLILAPGVSINSTYITGGYGTSSGTSMSTPHVAGAVAIINQYRRLEGSPDMTPSEIEDALNDSGKVISDAGSGLNFSRIKIYSTLMEIDQGGPIVTLSSPSNNTLSSNENQTFNCTASDIQLSNLTFYLWNSSSDLVNTTFFNATSNTLQVSVNQTLVNGTYTWNCVGDDNKSNSAWGSTNYTLMMGGMLVTLNSPSDDSYTTTNSTIFNCTIQDTVANLVNVTLKIWNSSNTLIYNTTSSITGTSNETTFAYNLTPEGAYDWNCIAYDEDSNSVSGSSNYTITFDKTNPVVTLVSPSDESSTTAGSVNFRFNVTDSSDIDNCSLIIESDLNQTDTSITKSTTQTITVSSIAAGDYEWQVRCYDKAGNMHETGEWDLTVTGSSSSGDDSSSSDNDDSDSESIEEDDTPTTFVIIDSDFEKGVSRNLKEDDKMKFNSDNESHTLELISLSSTKIKVKISSNPITLTIILGEEKKADLDSDNRYDVSVKYVSYTNSLARITIKSIDEAITTKQIANTNSSGDTIETTGTGNIITEIGDFFKNLGTWYVVGIVSGIIVLGGAGYIIYKKKTSILGPVFKKKYEKLLKK